MQSEPHLSSCGSRRRSCAATACLSLVFACSAVLSAQTAAPTTPSTNSPGTERPGRPRDDSPEPATRPAGSSGEKVYELSPFVVSAEEDRGYASGSVLSGTRLRSDLRDLAPSIQVVTKDFMRDVNAKDLTTLLVHTLGTEVAGAGGNFSGATVQSTFVDFETQLGNASPNTRIRGLIGADTARDFFITNVPLDGYNVERVEINRGANSLLFGLGSPGGILNYSLARAETHKNKTEVEYQFGSESSQRGVLNHNHVLIQDKLALRLAAVYDDTFYRAKPAFERRKAAYLATTYRPFRNTTIRLSAEEGRSDSSKPWGRTPFDGISLWWELGRPAYNPLTHTVTLMDGAPKPPFTLAQATNSALTSLYTAIGLGGSPNMISLFYSDPNSSVPGIPGVPYVGIKGFADRSMLASNGTIRNGGMLGLAGADRYLNNIVYASAPTRGFWRIPMLSDPSLFDFYHYMPDAGGKREWAEWKTANATLEQSFLDGRAGFELGFNREDLENGSVVPFSFIDLQLKIDINTHLPDGTVNPNFGRALMGGRGFVYDYATDLKVGRGTAYYKLDLRETGPSWLGKALGRHMLTGTYSDQSKRTETKQGYPFNTGVDYSIDHAGGVVRGVDDGRRQISIVHYMSPSAAQATSVRGVRAQTIAASQWPTTLRSVSVLQNTPAPAGATTVEPWTARTYGITSVGFPAQVDNTLIGPWTDLKGEKVKSGVLALQSHWWNGLLVTTGGWRRDTVDTYIEGSGATDPGTGVGVVTYNSQFVSRLREDSWSGGAVLHLPEAITRHLPLRTRASLMYSRSNNFKVTAQRFDVFDQKLGPETGRTEEYGVRLSFLDGKVDFKINRYETSANDSSSTVNLSTPLAQLVNQVRSVEAANRNGVNEGNNAGLAAWNAWKGTPGAQQFFRTFRFDFAPATPTAQARTLEVLPTSDTVSTGWEYELVANPTRRWRVAFNASKAEAVRDNTALDFRSLLNIVINPMLAGEAGTLLVGAQQASLREAIQLAVKSPLDAVVLQDGSPTAELRRWRFNVVTSYDLPWEFTKGWTVTANYRWQDRSAIGFPVTRTAAGIPILDVKNPYYGAREGYFGAGVSYSRRIWRDIRWRASLHLRNIGVGNELIKVHAQPDGTIDAWQIREPMRWTLSNTFTF